MHGTDDDLVRRALGQPVPDVDRHVGQCPRCAGELAALSETVLVGRAAGPGTLPPAPDAVWHRVLDDLGLAREPVPDDPGFAPYRPAGPQRTGPRAWLLAAAAAAVLGVAGAAILPQLSGSESPDRAPVAAPAAALEPVPATPVAPDGGGQVRLADDAAVLDVETRGLPPVDGYYEVWLLDPVSGRMVALGALGDDGAARLQVPSGVDPRAYPAVDVSVEQDDGDPAHSGVSALRAPVPA